MRGEKLFHKSRLCWCQGSPPHARGKGRDRSQIVGTNRITPACAGKSVFYRLIVTADEDHPRMRGEKPQCLYQCNQSVGSPPHARGKACFPFFSGFRIRITPACAGKSMGARPAERRFEDHPRMRGEKVVVFIWITVKQGSPPHARGKAGILTTAGQQLRITPACAGKREARARRRSRAGDHPRMRGEKTKKIPI